MLQLNNDFAMDVENVLPVSVKLCHNVTGTENLLKSQSACVSFRTADCACFAGKGAYIVLDYGRELCGGLRLLTSSAGSNTSLRITLGESMSEACSSIGEKNATNDHSPRDFVVPYLPALSDLTFGQSGFRFARIELLSDDSVFIHSIFAQSRLPHVEKEGYLSTNDPLLNQVLSTAAYTLKLNMQNGYIWDGIKRDRLVWCGDLNPEILVGAYLYGDVSNIRNSLRFLRNETPASAWINFIPTYSAWWVLNLCDYYRITGNRSFLEESRSYALDVIDHFDRCIGEDGTMVFAEGHLDLHFFLDWPTANTPDAEIGTAALLVYMARQFLRIEENEACHRIVRKLSHYLDRDCVFKQTRAFQIMAGRRQPGDAEFMEKDCGYGMSTFMSYYILKATALAGGTKMLDMTRQYFGGMLEMGATSFWEDFDLNWMTGCCPITRLPEDGERDIHGDHGAFCYIGLRHSLCHAWSSGVFAFWAEHLLLDGKQPELAPKAEIYHDGSYHRYE